MRTQKEAEELLIRTDSQPWIKKLQRAATLASIDNKLEEDICFRLFKKRITERIENKDSASFIEIFIPVYALFTHLLESNLTDEQFYAVISVEEVRKKEYEKLQKYLDLLSNNYNKKVTLDINEVLNTFEDWLTHKERTELYVKVTLELTQFGSYKEFLHFATWIRLSWEHNNNAPYAYPF